MSSNPTLDRFHTGCTVPGTWNAGVDGDINHTGEGYHTWRRLLRYGDYSGGRNGRNISPRDLGGRDNCAAGIDRGGSVPAVQIMTQRLLAAIATPRGRYLLRGVREFNGYDGRDVLNRDAVLGWGQNYKPGGSHKTHVHIGWFRDTCEDWAVISDALSVINGTANIHDAPTTPEDELNDADKKWLLDQWEAQRLLERRDIMEQASKSMRGDVVPVVEALTKQVNDLSDRVQALRTELNSSKG